MSAINADIFGGDGAQARRFEGQWSRFSRPDPSLGSYRLRDSQSFNRYSYSRNDPINRRDPSGLDDEVHPFVCLNCLVMVPISFENGVCSTISGLGDLLGRTLYDELLLPVGLNGQTTQQKDTSNDYYDCCADALRTFASEPGAKEGEHPTSGDKLQDAIVFEELAL